MLGWWERLAGRDDAAAVALVRGRLAGLTSRTRFAPLPADDEVPGGAAAAADVPHDEAAQSAVAARRWERPAARLAVVVLAIGVLVGGWWWWGSRERVGRAESPAVVTAGTPLAMPPTGVGGATPAGSAAPTGGVAPAAAVVVVHVVGPVRRPGVLRLPAGSRVADAVAAAGGLRPGADPGLVNLARVLVDGEQVVVGPGAPAGAPAATGASAPGAPRAPGAAPLDLNTATLADLDALPGVGPVLAQRILDFRVERGRFTSVEELREVSGIGEKTYADVSPRVRV